MSSRMRRLEGFPEFIPSTSRVSTRRHLKKDESPALTAVLQAQPRRIVPSSAKGGAGSSGQEVTIPLASGRDGVGATRSESAA
jgi:hypothetical protein